MSSPVIAPPASRNAPCPCGSGLRYKECHGAIAASTPASDPIALAQQSAAKGDRAAARKLCEQVLAATPDHPLALQLLAHGEYEEGRPAAALRLLMRAVRGLPRHAVAPAAAFGVWTSLNHMFTQALAGLDAAAAADRRHRYREWNDGRRGDSAARRDVSVVLLVRSSATRDAIKASLDSIVAQTLRPAELIIAGPHGDAEAAIRGRLDLLPFDVRFVGADTSRRSAALDAALRAATGAWAVVLEPPHAFAPRHLASLVEALVRSGATWGFAGCEWQAFGAGGEQALAARAAAGRALQSSIAEADTTGFAFIDQAFAPIGTGAVVFARALHGRLGGFRDLTQHEMWDFCLRALWHDEPLHLTSRTYLHRVSATEPEAPKAAREAALVAMFRDYYARACRDDDPPPNAFAPSLAAWGVHFLKRVFQSGHVLAIAPDVLDHVAERIAARAEASHASTLGPGVNLVGFAFGEFGLGESLRAFARACASGGIPFTVKDVDQRLQARQADRSIAGHVSDALQYRLSLLCLNPDMLGPVLPVIAATRGGGGRTVGYWYWELEHTPRAWDDAFERVDEVWCATDFIADAMGRATDKPVVKIPPPIEVALPRAYTRAEFGLPEGRFLFLFTFDFNSFLNRKNPEGAIAAFRSAFPPGRDDVGLVVKSINGAHRPELVARLQEAIGGDPRIHQLDAFFSREQTYGLTSVADAYVSLHRAEGLGLGLAEAMHLGKPAIATAYSGNLEFMHEGNSALVDYRMIPVAPGEYLYDDPRFTWADPDVEHAARHMRRLVDDPEWRAALAAAGQRTIRTRFTRERAAAAMRSRLRELGMLDERGPDTPPGTFVSYAQHGEDAVLARVLRDVTQGRYVDVGAHDPELHSVTRAFHAQGWSGVNIEPDPEWHARLVAERPRDVNLAVAATRAAGPVVLHRIAGSGLSTLDPAIACRHAGGGQRVEPIEVAGLPLSEIWDRHVTGEVHFLKIDVEGAEHDVLAGADLARHRPWVLVIEATLPLSAIPSHQAWEPRVLAAGYRLAHDDGLNRYYVAEEHAALLPRFSEPSWPLVRAAELVAMAPGLAREQRFDPGAMPFLDVGGAPPTLAQPTSQLCTDSQFREPAYREWCNVLREPMVFQRKQWEFVFELQVLAREGMLARGRRGLGFGCGREPLPAILAARGAEVLATDLGADQAAGRGWIETEQHAAALDDLNGRGLCDAALFRERVRFRCVDMNAIPDDLAGFDFVWSSCAFEHLGSLEHGLRFVVDAMRCVRPGGIAVHTTEFNLTSNADTIEAPDLSVFRRQDMERLERMLAAEGHRLRAINFHPGTRPLDRYVDLPPYRAEPHLKIRLDRYVITSIGLVIERAA